jgi:hypothetical protein
MALLGGAVTVYTIPDPVDSFSVAIAARLPVNPMAWGFTQLVVDSEDNPCWQVQGQSGQIAGVLQAEGSRMEKRKGQVWPR